jgi:hypothetical protein
MVMDSVFPVPGSKLSAGLKNLGADASRASPPDRRHCPGRSVRNLKNRAHWIMSAWDYVCLTVCRIVLLPYFTFLKLSLPLTLVSRL